MDGLKVLVTGANRGIGLEIVRQLLQLGHQVWMAGRSFQKVQQAAELLSGKVFLLEMDVSSDVSVEKAFQRFSTEASSLDVLINNAGIFPDRQVNTLTISLEQLDEVMNSNFKGALRTTRTFLPMLERSKDPRIVNLSSGLGALAGMGGGFPAYRISKTALNALTVILSADLSEKRIRVNAMCPGWVKTEMGGIGAVRSLEDGAETAVWLATAADIPNGKFLRDRKVIDW
jgi:NAD(P)-dependent dehydrogenase (short-subunit alcohol dehydrogenase family)